MKLLASCDIDKAMSFNGKLVLPNEDEKRPDKVFLNIVVDDACKYSNEEIFKKASEMNKNTIKCITFMVESGRFANYVPTEWQGKVFNEYFADSYHDPNIPVCTDAISLLRVKEDFSNMRVVLENCKKHPDVRFIGGNLLGMEGVRIGRFDDGKDKMSPVFKGIYDTFVEVDLNDLDGIKEIVRKTRKRAESLESKSGKPKVKKLKEKKVSKRVVAFSSLFSDMEEDEF